MRSTVKPVYLVQLPANLVQEKNGPGSNILFSTGVWAVFGRAHIGVLNIKFSVLNMLV